VNLCSSSLPFRRSFFVPSEFFFAKELQECVGESQSPEFFGIPTFATFWEKVNDVSRLSQLCFLLIRQTILI
jgi:hypothetical protein